MIFNIERNENENERSPLELYIGKQDNRHTLDTIKSYISTMAVVIYLPFITIILIFGVDPSVAEGGIADMSSNDDQASQDMMEHDPNIINPQNDEGYGDNIPTTISGTSGRRAKSKLFPLKNSMKEKKHIETDTVAKQTVQAALQLGVLIGVGIMFVVLFMVIVAVELVCKAMHEKLECGHYKKTDVEDVDPAALVGTFKRYK